MKKTIGLLVIMMLYVPVQAGDFGDIYAGKQEKIIVPQGIDPEALASLPRSSESSHETHPTIIKEQSMTSKHVVKLLLSKVDEKEKEIITNTVDEIVWMNEQGAHCYAGLANRPQADIDYAFKSIERVFKAKDIAIAHLQRCDWFHHLDNALGPNPEINIARFDKAELLMELFNTANYTLAQTVPDRTRKMTIQEAQKIINEWPRGQKFDYLEQKPLKIDIWNDKMNAQIYNRDNGRHAAHCAVSKLLKRMVEKHVRDQKEVGIEDVDKTQKQMQEALYKQWAAECFKPQAQL
jgi:hypothetical protein